MASLTQAKPKTIAQIQTTNIQTPSDLPLNPPSAPMPTLKGPQSIGPAVNAGLIHRLAVQKKNLPIEAGRALISATQPKAISPTPWNTPSSLEQISRKIATGLQVGDTAGQGKIAPSYE